MKKLDNIKDFDNIISKRCVVDFYADWCGPCKMLEPVIEEVNTEHSDIEFLSVNVDDFRDIAKKYGVMSIPCVKVFDDGKEVKSSVGFMSKSELEEFIK